jgi:hypothetical protein
LLRRNVPIDGNDYFEAGGFSGSEQVSVTEPSQTCVSGRLGIMASEEMPELLINTLIK